MHRRKTRIATLGGLLLIGIAGFGLWFPGGRLPSAEATGSARSDTALTQSATSDGAPLLGNPVAPVTIVLFTDFACPHCATYAANIDNLIEIWLRSGSVRLELRMLNGVNPEGSLLAANAAMCASEQSSLWDFHEALFALQPAYGRAAFTEARLISTAAHLGLDETDFGLCLTRRGRLQNAFQRNIDLALALDVQTLPAVLIRYENGPPTWLTGDNGPLHGPVGLETLRRAIIDTLAP